MLPALRQVLMTPPRDGDRAIFGVQWNPALPTTTLTRTHGARNRVANVGIDSDFAANDFDRAAIFGEMVSVTDTLGNVFIRIPKFYIKKTSEANLRTLQVSKTKYPGFYLPWCFWDFTNSCELPYLYYGKHTASLDGSALASKASTYPLINKNIVDFRTYAQANNAGGLLGYQQLDVHAYDVLTALMTVEFGTLNMQSVMQGYTAGQYSATHTAAATEASVNRIIVANATAALYRVGQAISIGTALGDNQRFYGRTITAIDVYDASNKAISFDGAAVSISTGDILYNTGWKSGFSSGISATSGCVGANDGKYPCSYRGIESPYGDVWQFVDGVNINEGQAWVAVNAADYASNLFAAPYAQLAYVNGSTDGYASQMGYDPSNPSAEFPTSVAGGGSTSYYSDDYYQTTGQRVARVGGLWIDGSLAGPWRWALSDVSSDARVDIGGRLLKKGL